MLNGGQCVLLALGSSTAACKPPLHPSMIVISTPRLSLSFRVACRHRSQVLWNTKETFHCPQVTSSGSFFTSKSMRDTRQSCIGSQGHPSLIVVHYAGAPQSPKRPQAPSDGADTEHKAKQQASSQTADFIASHTPTRLSKAQGV